VIRPTLIDRYVFREILVSFVFCFAVFLVTGLIAGFLPLLQKGMESDLGLTAILFQLLIHALPGTLVTILPLSLTLGILLGLGRLAADNEIAALKSAGISILRLFPPVLLLGLIGLGLALACTLYLIPRGISEGRRLAQEALLKRPDAGIEEHAFFDSLKDVILYVDRIDPASATMEGVFIKQSSDPEELRTIIAKKGKSQPDPDGKAFILHLLDGTILQENRQGDVKIGTFEKYIFRYPLEHAGLGGRQLEPDRLRGLAALLHEQGLESGVDRGLLEEHLDAARRVLGRLPTPRRPAAHDRGADGRLFRGFRVGHGSLLGAMVPDPRAVNAGHAIPVCHPPL